MNNILLLTNLLLQYATKLQEIADLFGRASFENRDVTDAEIDATSLKRDAAIERAQASIDSKPAGASVP